MSKKTYAEISVSPNLEQTKMILAGLDLLPEKDKTKVTYQRLRKELETIQVIWKRRVKNEEIKK